MRTARCLGLLAVGLWLGYTPMAMAQVSVKIEVIQATLKLDHGKLPTVANIKNPKSMMKQIERKTLEKTQVSLRYGQPASVKLPNGAELKLTAISFDPAKRMIKMRVQTIVEHYGLDTEYSIKNGGLTFVNAGVYQKTSMLMVSLSPSQR